jgi:hypothetical protein
MKHNQFDATLLALTEPWSLRISLISHHMKNAPFTENESFLASVTAELPHLWHRQD